MKKMHKGIVATAVAGLGAVVVLNTPIVAQPNSRGDKDGRQDHGPRDGRGPREGGRPEGGPRRGPGPSVEQLDEVANLTPDQEKKISAVLDNMHEQMKKLHDDTKKRIDGILTAEQRAKLEKAREDGPPRGEGDGPPRGGERGGREGRGPREGRGGPRDDRD